MLLRNVLVKTLRDLRWPTFWTGLGLGLLGFYFLWIFPTFAKTMDLESLMEKFPPALKALVGGSLMDFSSATGFLNLELFPLMLPLVLAGFAIALASGATAAEEGRGTLDVLLSGPVERWQVLVDKSIAIVIATCAVALALFVGLWASAALNSVTLVLEHVAAGLASGTLLALAFGSLALVLACGTGNRSLAIGVPAALLVVTYFINALAPMVDALDKARPISPFYYYLGNDPLRNGLDPGHALVLAAVAAVGFVLALVVFERRDLAT